MEKKINGPTNVIRLEGEINNIKKVLYVFMDIHVDIQYQTKCGDFLSEDVALYIKKELLKKHDKYIDFFMEYRISDPEDKSVNFKRKYMVEMWKFFYQNYQNKGKGFTNVRFHYVDIRDNVTYLSPFLLNNYRCTFQYIENDYKYIVDQYDLNVKYLNDVENILIGKQETTEIVSLKEIKKLHKKYKNDVIKNKIKILIDYFIAEKQKLLKLIENNITMLTDHKINCFNSFTNEGYSVLVKNKQNKVDYGYNETDDLYEIKKNHAEIFSNYIKIISLVMDIYFLRRYCDKEYITNGIFYGGAYHCFMYINFLINQFDFKITHASYTYISIDETNKLLKKKIYDYYDVIYLFEPTVLQQCSDISSFPDNFE